MHYEYSYAPGALSLLVKSSLNERLLIFVDVVSAPGN